MYRIETPYSSALITEIRDANASPEVLRDSLSRLGRIAGEAIIGQEFLAQHHVTTPIGQEFQGLRVVPKYCIVVSTLDDYGYFGKGIAGAIRGARQGYMDFGGLRGPDALTRVMS